MKTPGRDSLAWPILIGWAIAALVFCIACAAGIARMRFLDPDDAMRLLEVRDWLGGQGFYDVWQHRLAGGAFSMHWSRLVDMPLAAVMLIADPLFGEATSNRIAMVAVPLLTLLIALAVLARMTERMAGREAAVLAVLVAPLSPPFAYQMLPMRIDHHAWQAVLALLASLLVLQSPTARRGALAGLALGTLLTISLEGMPFMAAVVTIAALAWVLDDTRGNFLRALAVGLFASALLLHVATRGPGMLLPACDAMAPGWLAALGVAAVAIALSVTAAPRSPLLRLALLGAGGAASLLALRAIAPDCLHGPFASLDPLVRTFWYEQVLEGLPLWDQSLSRAAMTVALPLVGLGVSARMAWVSRGDARARWLLLGALLVAATAIACLVNRAGITANALAVPGTALLLTQLLGRARAIQHALPRIVATVLALLMASPGMVAATALLGVTALTARQSVAEVAPRSRFASCDRFDQVRALNQLPPATIFAPMDVTPDLIATGRHHAIAGGYHRNARWMEIVIRTFTSSPDRARRIVQASGATYLAACPDLSEVNLYRMAAPDGLWGQLARGVWFDWLQPVPIAGSPVLAWRVVAPVRQSLRSATARR